MRKPLTILGAEVDDEQLVVNSAGQVRGDVRIYVDHEDMGAMRAGYYCAKCYEPQEEAFPLACWVCKFPMREKQAEFIAKGYRGDVRTGPQATEESETAYMNEYAAQRRVRERGVTPQIWLPGDSI